MKSNNILSTMWRSSFWRMKSKTLSFLLLCLGICTSSVWGQVNIYFTIQNEVVNGSFYEFDVYMYADQTGTFHSRGQVYVYYNPDAFGSSVVSNGNATYSHLSLLNGNGIVPPSNVVVGPKYTTLTFVDNGPRVALTWRTNFRAANPSTSAHNEVPTTPTPLYHVRLAIQDGTKPANLALDFGLMVNQQFYLVAPNSETPYTDGVLPVELTNFTGKKLNDQQVNLNWSTASETNNDHFVIEKKIGEEGTYEEIGTVNGAGTTSVPTHYQYLDRSPMGQDNYYRLRQVNLNGGIAYSDEIKISFDLSSLPVVTAFPNPVTSSTTLRVNGSLEGTYAYQVNDLSGKMLKRGTISPEDRGEVTLDLTDLAEGIYILRWADPNGKVYVDRLAKR